MVFRTNRTSETIQIGRSLGRLLEAGDVVALIGDLGTGKTQFIKGLAQGAGVAKAAYVSSPSFTLIHEYEGRTAFYHIDLFRLESEKEAEGLGLEEYFDGNGITAIEWADRISSRLPETLLLVKIEYIDQYTRSIELIPKGKRYEELIRKMSDLAPASWSRKG